MPADEHERFYMLPAPKYSLEEAAALAQMDPGLAATIYRAVGRPGREPEARYLDDLDVEGLRAFTAIRNMGTPLGEMIAMTRAYGFAMARLADAEAGLFRAYFLKPLIEGGVQPEQIDDAVEPIATALLRMTDVLLHTTRRVHLGIALREAAAEGATGERLVLAVAFVDLVGYSQMSEDIPPEALSELVTAFENLAIDACVNAGARMVKVIGDAVMLVSPQPERAMNAAQELLRGTRDDPRLPSAKAGIDCGEVVTLAGDYFGPPVNTASRMIGVARPDTLVASKRFIERLGKDIATTQLGAPELKGIGRVELFEVG